MFSTGSQQSGRGHESKQSVIKIDHDGDLTLVAGKPKARFLVCSKSLSRSAPFWNRCLYGPFKESKPAAGHEWVVELPEDSPGGLECVLLLVHGLGHKMPTIDLQLAFEITVITNKYDMTRYLWAFVRPWLQDLEPPRPDEGGDGTIVPQLKWLWVTKELGDSGQHGQTFAELTLMVCTTSNGDGHLVLRPYEQDETDVLTPETLGYYEAEMDVIFALAGKRFLANHTRLS